MKPKKLRLLITSKCNRKCPGCCNKDWELNKLPKATHYNGYDEILLTGGEPMLDVELIQETVYKIRETNTTAKIYMYTAMPDPFIHFLLSQGFLDGITLTLHTIKDIAPFILFHEKWRAMYVAAETDTEFGKSRIGQHILNASLKLNVFKQVRLKAHGIIEIPLWEVKDNMEWIKDCPLPKGEEFKQL